jgi:small conductance mechanosensitive channel
MAGFGQAGRVGNVRSVAVTQPIDQLEAALAGTQITGWDVVWAVVAIIVAVILSRLARGVMWRLLRNVDGLSLDAKQLICRVTALVVILLGIAVAISLIGGNSAPIVIILIIGAVILALALRGTAENFAAGIVLQTRGSIKVGDEIAALGFTGIVEELNGRSVVVRTIDGRILHLPNAKVIEEPLANHSTLGARRSELSIECTSSADIGTAIEAITRAATQAEGVLADPAPWVVVISMGGDGTSLVLRFWHAPSEGPVVTARVVAAVARSIDDTGVISVGPVAPVYPGPPR